MKVGKLIRAGARYITDPGYRFILNADAGRYDRMPDEEYLKRRFRAVMGRPLELGNPQTFNEKLQWLKLNDRRAEYTAMVDKLGAKEYVKKLIGDKYIIPTLGAWNSFDDIDFNALPDSFVLKCTHDSGGLVIVKNKKTLDLAAAGKKIEKSLKTNYYLHGREWPYKDVPRRIIAEKYMTDSPDTEAFTDYKFFCFNGKPDCVMICTDREIHEPKFYFFNEEWKLCRYNKRGKELPDGFTLPKPQNIAEMFELARALSANLPFARIDLYNSDGRVYFGEITFYPDSGFDANILPETDIYFGSLIKTGGLR